MIGFNGYLAIGLIVASYIVNYLFLRYAYDIGKPVYDNNGKLIDNIIEDRDKSTIGKIFLFSPIMCPVFIILGTCLIIVEVAIAFEKSRSKFFTKIGSFISRKETAFAVLSNLHNVNERKIAFSSVQELEDIYLVNQYKRSFNFSKFVIDNYSENESTLFALFKNKDWPQYVGKITWLKGERLDIPVYHRTDEEL